MTMVSILITYQVMVSLLEPVTGFEIVGSDNWNHNTRMFHARRCIVIGQFKRCEPTISNPGLSAPSYKVAVERCKW